MEIRYKGLSIRKIKDFLKNIECKNIYGHSRPSKHFIFRQEFEFLRAQIWAIGERYIVSHSIIISGSKNQCSSTEQTGTNNSPNDC